MNIASTLERPDVLCAGFLARFERVEVPIDGRTDDRGGVYFQARIVLEEPELKGVGDIVVTALPVGRRLSEAAIGKMVILRVTAMSLGKPFSGLGGVS